MSDLPPIRLNNLGVSFDLRRSKTRVRRQVAGKTDRLDEHGRFWALRNISLTVESGESLAVIGANGAGKSTLLKTLAGIILPDEGTIEVRGSIATLLQLAAGFKDELDAEDNILLVGEFLGVPSKEMKKRVQDILDFAAIGEFADAPVSTYSSGMRARLGFSVATSVEPDVLLLDEVLSTGDASFREKSRARIVELMNRARAIVYVTHDLESAATFCTRAIELRDGKIVAYGPSGEVVEQYKSRMLSTA
ncbi:MAG: ABC transporter ATP-binding protein [Candidatus Limnocylindrus sp.]